MSRRPHQLPPGRHGLPRSVVESNQRERLLTALAEVTSRRGFARMRIADVIEAAGVSRRTFYEHFANKEDAFLAAYDDAVARLTSEVVAAVDAASDLPAKVRAGLGALLDFIVREPAFAHMCIVEVLAAGPAAMARRSDAMETFATLIDDVARTQLGSAAPPPLTSETLVGGIYEVVFARMQRGQARELPALLPDLTYSALLPYADPRAAS